MIGGAVRLFPVVGVALLTCALVSGCSSSQQTTGRFTAVIPDPSASAIAFPAAALPADLSVEIEQERSDYGIRQLEVRVTNTGSPVYVVSGVSFSSPNFVSPVDNTEPGKVLPALSLDFPVRLPGPVCTGDRSAGPSVTLDWAATDLAGSVTSSGRSTVVPTDPLGAMTRINGEDCLAQGVADIVTIAAANDLRVEGAGATSVAHIDLTLTATGAPGQVQLQNIGQTPLLAPLGGGDSWAVGRTLDGSTPTTPLTLDAQPGRCEPHVIAEDKRGTFLPLTVTVTTPGAAPVSGTYYLALSDTAKAETYRWLADHCGF